MTEPSLQPLKDTYSLLLDQNFSIFKVQEGKKGKGGTQEKEEEGGTQEKVRAK